MKNNENKKRKIISPVRLEKLEEGQEILENIAHQSTFEQIFELFKDRMTIESGFSIRELALLFFPRQAKPNPKTGTPTPTLKAILETYALLNDFRKSDHNNSVVLYTKENSNDESILYRMKTYKEFEETKKQLMSIIAGLYNSIEDSTEHVTRSEEEIKERDLQFEKTLREMRHNKRKRSNDDDEGVR